MKLAQRIVLSYYRNKFKALALVSPRIAAEQAFKLLCTPYTKRKKYKEPLLFKKAIKLSFKIDTETLNGFKWKAERYNNGMNVLICHGFDSNSYRFENYIQPLLDLGFTVIAFDAPAHGLSSGKTINANQYKNAIIKINEMYGPINATIAHSFGGIAVALATEEFKEDHHKRLVLIAPATETTRSINTFFSYIPVSKRVREEFEKVIEEVGGNPASWFSISRIIQKLTTPTLWVQDKEDIITPYEDMHHLVEMKLPHIRFEITQGLGHSNIYKDARIVNEVVSFIGEMVKEVVQSK